MGEMGGGPPYGDLHMDAIDSALLNAWNRLAPAIRANRAQALRRALRRTRPTLSRPIRPWCLCIRASDTRLTYPLATPLRDYALDERLPHSIHISGINLRKLCAPVDIPWPGIDWTHAADLLGRHPESLRGWIARGIFECTRRNARSAGKRGKPVPFIWSRFSLDPAANHAAPPDPIWGTLWRFMHERIPADDDYVLKRIPVEREYSHPARDFEPRHRGWSWLCPGIRGRSCGRPASRLFIPLTPWTLLDALDESDPLDLTIPIAAAARPRRSAAPPHELVSDAPSADPLPIRRAPVADGDLLPSVLQPACHHCHRIRYFSLTGRDGWNLFVTHISRGLLFGHEVKRPAQATPQRKRRYVAHKRSSPRRDQVRALSTAGMMPARIARIMNVKVTTVYSYLKQLRRRGELPRIRTPLRLTG
jgi:hypothetical protein